MANGGFILAAYLTAAIVLVGYTLSLWARLARAREEAAAEGER